MTTERSGPRTPRRARGVRRGGQRTTLRTNYDAARITSTDSSISSRVINVATAPAALRSSSHNARAARNTAGARTVTDATSARWETLAELFARRIASSTSHTGPYVVPAPITSSVGNSFNVGHGDAWTEWLCHQCHTSSVTKGMIGANSRCSTDSVIASVARADLVAASSFSPYARIFTNST